MGGLREGLVQEAANAAGRRLNDSACRKLANYIGLLVARGERTDLLADLDEEHLVNRHMVDSLSLLWVLPKRHLRIIDVGSGAGFPGVVLSIARPEDAIALLEPRERRADFLREVVAVQELRAEVIQGRAEELGRSQLRECYDVAVARALGAPPEALELALPLVERNGMVVLMAGPSAGRVLSQIDGISRSLGGQVGGWMGLRLPDGRERVVIWVHKVEATAQRFPRTPARILREARAWEDKVDWMRLREVHGRGREE